MITSDAKRALFLASFREAPIVSKLRNKFDFICAATVATGPSVDFQQARDWAIPRDETSVRNLVGRVLPHLIYPEGGHVLWDFEFLDDAMLFVLKFGGNTGGPLDVGEWRRSVLFFGLFFSEPLPLGNPA